jgi:hypothetical protein
VQDSGVGGRAQSERDHHDDNRRYALHEKLPLSGVAGA